MKTTLITPDEELAHRDRPGFIPVEQYVGEIRRNDVGYIAQETGATPVLHPESGVWSRGVEVLERIALKDGE